MTKVTREEGVETITLASPATRNALSLDMMLSVTEELTRCKSKSWEYSLITLIHSTTRNISIHCRAGRDKDVRAVVLRGEGKVLVSLKSTVCKM